LIGGISVIPDNTLRIQSASRTNYRARGVL